MSTTSLTSKAETAPAQDNLLDRLFPYVLLAIVFAALVPMLVLGASRYITYDGYWHLFIASQNRWKQFLFEYKANAHPILYFLLLRIVQLFGHSQPILRSGSIVPGAGAIYMTGLVAAKLCRSRIVALLTAAAYAFSMVMIEIEIDIRSYSLCLCFVVTAFYFLVDFLNRDFGPKAGRPLLLFGIFSSAAIASEYYAVFFVAACAAGVLAILAWPAELRGRAIQWIVANWRSSLAAIALPAATLEYFYLVQIRHQPLEYGHLGGFYYVPGYSRMEFILRNLRADLNYILPIEIKSTSILLVALAIMTAILMLVFSRGRPPRIASASLPGLIALAIFAELIVVSLRGRYPFGGFERQQSILFPFIILTGFVLLDRVISFLPSEWLRTTVLIIPAALIGLNFHYRWERTPKHNGELFPREYATLQETVPHPEAIFLDQFTVIGYYVHAHDSKWKFFRTLREPDRIDEYRLATPSGQKFFLLRDIDQWNVDLRNAAIYQTLARVIRDAQLTSASIFLLKQVPGPSTPKELLQEQTQVAQLAAAAGLKADIVHDDNAQAEVTFRPVPPQPIAK